MKSPPLPRRRPSGTKKTAALIVVVEEPLWRKRAPVLAAIRRAARLTLVAGRPRMPSGKAPSSSVTLLLTNDARLAALNGAFRGKDRPTNVLSFPALDSSGESLGDIGMAYGTVAREARTQGKTLADHAAHLAVHGVLHLFGWKHEKSTERKAMESLEKHILSEMGIADPYAPRLYTARRKAA